MKTTALLFLLLLIVPFQSQAVHINLGGSGQVLLFPYYTVDNSIQSLLTVRNTTGNAKAVKVIIREGMNHRSVLDFNLYLGRNDTWTAALFAVDEDGSGNLLTLDSACTVPDIIGQTTLAPNLPTTSGDVRYVPLRNFEYVGANDDEGPNNVSRTRQGMIEVIEMGVLTDDSQGSASATIVSSSGEPRDCQQLNRAWQIDEFGLALPDSYWVDDPGTDLQPPEGGLTGSLSLINVLDATLVTTPGQALESFTAISLHTDPGDDLPNLTSVNVDSDADGFVDSRVIDPVSGRVIVSNWDDPIDAVSALFMTASLIADYSREVAIDSATELLLNLPTKRYYTDEALLQEPIARPPFSSVFSAFDPNEDGACEVLRTIDYSREAETFDYDSFLCAPILICTPPQITSCSATQVLSTESTADTIVAGGELRTTQNLDYETGQLQIQMTHPDIPRTLTDREGRAYLGLPVTGVRVQAIRNAVSFSPGVIGNYATSHSMPAHRIVEQGQ